MKIDVLGTPYEYTETDMNDPVMQGRDGYCDLWKKKIAVKKSEYMDGDTEEACDFWKKHVILHELVHAFSMESGASYGDDEALVDWIAHMIPRISAAYESIMREEKNELPATNE